MNKVYKVIYSKARQCYVVVSELAKSHGKTSTKAQTTSGRKIVLASLAAAVLTFGSMVNVAWAANKGDIVNGDGASIDNYSRQDGSIAVGKNAKIENMIGVQEYAFFFNQSDPSNWGGSVAIGNNTYARSGSIMIGSHNYRGKIGDQTVDTSNTKAYDVNVNATTLGTNSFNQGAFSTVNGSYSIISGKYDGSRTSSSYGAQNFGATITGSLNSIESATSSNYYSGVANSIVGTANRSYNSNGALIFGAGNEITNSITNISVPTSGGDSAQTLQKNLMKAVQNSKSGGATLAIGGGNKADWTQASQLIGVNNTLKGTEDSVSKYNLVDGFENTLTNSNNTYVIGTENNFVNMANSIVLGDNNKRQANNTDRIMKDTIVIGDGNTVQNGDESIAIGKNIRIKRDGGTGYDYDTGNVAIGSNAYISSYVNQGDSIAIGKNASVINMNGSLEQAFAFGRPMGKEYSGSIAIGENAYARSGSTMIGVHDYQGKLGDMTIDFTKGKQEASSGIMDYSESIDATTIGNNSYNNGTFSTVLGSYSAVSGLYHNAQWGSKPYGVQNFGAAMVGSLNSVESLTSKDHNTAGMADSILGSANRTQNANGTVMVGAGNVVTNSIKDFDASGIKVAGGISDPNALSEAMRTAIKDQNGGGAAAVVGNGNFVDNATNVSILGSKNSLKNTAKAQLLGDNRVVDSADNSVIVGSADSELTTSNKNVTVLGYNANASVDGGVALGSGSLATVDKGVAGYDPKGEDHSSDTTGTWNSTAAAVSVGNKEKNLTRQITGVAAGSADTDAVNVAQLKQVNTAVAANKVHYYSVNYTDTRIGNGNYNNDGAKGANSMVIGIASSSDALYSTVIGMENTAKKLGTSKASGMYDTVVGQYLDTTGSYNSVFGTIYKNGSVQQLTQVYGDRNTVLGAGNVVGIGKDNTKIKSDENTVIGVKNQVEGDGSIVVGNATTVDGENATSIGHVNHIYNHQEGGGQWGVALGNNLTVKGEFALAVGNNSTAQGDQTVAIGYNASANVAGGAAIGSGSVASVDKGVEGYKPNSSVDTSEDPAGTWKSTDAAISIGKADGSMTRQITGVAAGTNATDAVNVAQLKQAVAGVKDGNDTLVSDSDALKLNGNTLSMNIKDTAGNTVSGSVDLSKFAQAVDTNTTYTMEGKENGDNTTTISLKDNTGNTSGSVTVATKDTRNTVKAGENVTLDTKDNADGSHEYTVNVKADGKVAAGDTKLVSGDTVYNETRVQQDGTYVKKDKTAGENITALDHQVANNTQNITNINGHINDLDSRVNKVGAGAAALAALHPLDFDPDDKWDFAVGYGNYRDANSVAVGAFYRPDEDTMFSLGTNFGNGENMINAGVSFKFGQKGKTSSNRLVINKEVTELRATVSRQDEQLKKQDDQLKKQDNEIKELKDMVNKLLAAQNSKAEAAK